MANITPRRNKKGDIISYRIRVAKGYDAQGNKLNPYVTTWKPKPGMTKRQIEKELQRQATLFEEQCRLGLVGDGSQKFEAYAEYVLDLKVRSGELRHHTLVRYKDLLKRINAGIGYMKLTDIRPQHLNQLYEQLSKEGIRLRSGRATLKDKEDLVQRIRDLGYTNRERFVKEKAGISVTSLRTMQRGESVMVETAEKVVNALGVPLTDLFDVEYDTTPLSPKTIREHHRVIRMVLHQAECEMLIPYNPAAKAKPPKAESHEAEYFQLEEITAIMEAAEQEPLKWKTLIHLLLVTGGRRGELMGLTWDNINFNFDTISIEKTLNYEPDRGLYIDIPKTSKSTRFIKVPKQTTELLQQYRDEYWQPLRKAAGKAWSDWEGGNFLFVQDSGKNIGAPMHPDSITQYCGNFANKYDLPHIHPHAFRHTAASVLYFKGMDIISISRHLGHASPSTTQNIYAHMIAEAESRAADCMGQLLLSTKKDKNHSSNSEEDEKLKKNTAG